MNEESNWHDFLIDVGNIRCDLAPGGHNLHFIGSVINRLGVKSCLYIVGTPVGAEVIPCVRSICEKFRWILEM